MCKVAQPSKTDAGETQNKPSFRFLMSLESFETSATSTTISSTSSVSETSLKQETATTRQSSENEASHNTTYTCPSLSSCLLTGSVIVAVLTLMQVACYEILTALEDAHPILQDKTHRQILARHIGVDAFSCIAVSIFGWSCRHINQDVLRDVYHKTLGRWGGNQKTLSTMPAAGHEQRLFTYHPGGFRVALFFFCYQVKNLYDTIVWNDGPEFIFHHIFSLFTAYGAMSPGCGHFYAIFFFGLCEISTGVLCLLANFDDEHGVPGLGDAFPMVKVALGAVFIFLFILCRCILWPIFSYYFSRDVLLALKGSDSRTNERRKWMKFFLVSLTGLSLLQLAWLGQILVVAKEELTSVGLL